MLHTEEPISFSAVSKDYISDYEELLTRVFQKEHLTREYLDWLYFQNPNGAAVGYDAFCGKTLIGHYVCIPI